MLPAPPDFFRAEFRGTTFFVARMVPARVELHWRGADGRPLRTFAALEAHLGRRPAWAANAGIFMRGGAPLGLHVQNGRELRPLNTRRGGGNFYLQPNGVVLVKKGRAEVVTTSEYAEYARRGARPDLAVQSGPMLLIGGKVNAAFRPGSRNRLARNGVGVDGRGRLVFAITAPGEVTNFDDFARLFSRLGCKNALYLDGTISAQLGRDSVRPISNEYGAFFAVR